MSKPSFERPKQEKTELPFVVFPDERVSDAPTPTAPTKPKTERDGGQIVTRIAGDPLAGYHDTCVIFDATGADF